MKTYTIAFSPCPNDTFIFDAMVHHKIDTKGLKFEYVLEDVEQLNNWAIENRYDISKISYATLPLLVKNYKLLPSGSALGNGVGPLLLTKKPLENGIDLNLHLKNAKIAIPGENTTANFLLSGAFPDAINKEVVLFSDIEQGLLEDKYDVGLVIHESRFTYKERGLHCLMDMGNWWEQTTQLPIPLGGIVMKKSIATDESAIIAQLIKSSIAYAWQQYPELAPFVVDNAQEMSEDVMRKHINLYVNKNSEDISEKGILAIEEVLKYSNTDTLSQLEWVSF